MAKDMAEMSPAIMKRSKVAAATKRIVNYMNRGFYQVLSAEVGCLAPDTPIQMDDGTVKRADEVRAGDVILAYDGLVPVFDRVKSARREPAAPMVAVRTAHGREIATTENHPFYRMIPGRRQQDLTYEYDWAAASDLAPKERLAVSLGWPANWQATGETIGTLEAWAIGAWMGDGDCTHFRFINPDDEVVDKLRSFLAGLGSELQSSYSTRQKQEGKDGYQKPIEHVILGNGRGRKSPGREWIRLRFGQQVTCRTKKIPDCIWKGGPDVWTAFLAGYLDTDGCVTNPKDSASASICSVNPEVLDQLQMLFGRLGVNASRATEKLVRVSGYPQLQWLWTLISPHMVHPQKRERLEAMANYEIGCLHRVYETDRIASVAPIGDAESVSFEMETYQTHDTAGLITHNTKHGFNVSGLVFDELHTQPNRKLYDVLTKGSGDAREQPFYFLITTAGTDRESICYELHQKARDILAGRKADPTFYPVIYGLEDGEDWTKEENWFKANPSLGLTVKLESVRDMFRDAMDNPAEENVFKQLRLNMWVSSLTQFIPDHVFARGNDPIDTDALAGRECYGGLDLSSTDDVTAFVLVFPPPEDDPDGQYVVIPHFWIPEDTVPIRVRRASVPYDVWVQKGLMHATEGNVVHYGFIEEKIRQLGETYHILEIAFDRWGATQMSQDLTGMGFTVVPMGQGFASMSPPTKEFYKLLMEGRIRHGGNPVLRWMAGNVVVDTDPAGNIKPTKQKSTEKIDGIVATVMALDRCIRHDVEAGSVYDDEDRGLISF